MLKSQLICSYCSKIFKDPILLPCDHSICREHLSERTVVKENKIKCNECKQTFQVKDNQFKSNTTLKKLIESQSFLGEEEISLKHDLEESIRIFFEFYEEFIQNKSKLESDVFDHFQEIRFQIDEQREELKKKIDEIAFEMIEYTKKYESTHMKTLNEKSDAFLKSFETKSVKDKLNEIEETFRSPNLLIETIKEMQQRQDESLNDIQSKLNEMNQINSYLKSSNYFKPNVSSYNQEMFGLLQLNDYSVFDPFKSQILNNQQSLDLINISEFSFKDKWSLLYRGTRDGFGAHDFHSKCDGHSNTLTILKARQSSHIFGGFTSAIWDSLNQWKVDSNAFLFSLTNKNNTKPCKLKIDPNRSQYAIWSLAGNGPTFGIHDVRIVNDANRAMNSCSNLGSTYKLPPCVNGSQEDATFFLAGSPYFQLSEIEVYSKI